MDRKRGGFDLKNVTKKIAKLDQKTARPNSGGNASSGASNPFLTRPVDPAQQLAAYLTKAREQALKYTPDKPPIGQPFCEIETRLGILQVPFSSPKRRVTSSGAKHVQGKLALAFLAGTSDGNSKMNQGNNNQPSMVSGVSRQHFTTWTGAGVSESSGLTQALGCKASESKAIKQEIQESSMVETVYTGYPNDRRCSFAGIVHDSTNKSVQGAMEYKEKLQTMDMVVPAAPYDVRIALSSEKTVDRNVGLQPPPGWTSCRVKRRKSYARSDHSIGWQIDVTQVTTTYRSQGGSAKPSTVDYEIEMEILPAVLLSLINESDPQKVAHRTKSLAAQLWWMLSSLNPLEDPLDVDEMLEDHPNHQAVQLALAQCGALKQFMDRGGQQHFDGPIGSNDTSNVSRLANLKFMGCMPVNFSRHDLDRIQRESDSSYYLSEKTDGVRHLMVFTGDTVVLVDRAMRGKRPKCKSGKEPFEAILPLIQPGTVFDGEVVMNRRDKPRPIFIVFDVLCVSPTQPVLQLDFEQRLLHLKKATFRTKTANRNMFDDQLVANPNIALPLVRKRFFIRTEVGDLLSNVNQERGMRIYRNGPIHNHLTDGIIFQPNRAYVCGTDTKLLKWKYLDTATVDVEIMQDHGGHYNHNADDDDEVLRVACLGEDQTRVDMTRYVSLPVSERLRLAADRHEASKTAGRGQPEIAEVGFDPETGDWYYLTMRGDKIAPNHISTVLGTMLELAESLSTEELRYRMSVPSHTPDTYRKDVKGMMRQLLAHQKNALQKQKR